MIPYSIIKEVNPDHAKGSATGAMNFLVFVMTALAAPAIGWWMQKLAGGAALTLDVFVDGRQRLCRGDRCRCDPHAVSEGNRGRPFAARIHSIHAIVEWTEQ